ncbi:E3 ubiquitin-protein ligase rnf146-like [Patiria miniata]|uniref:E3 ubiquitin-protein ligase n=1 Tax=Patiria miniata TaxID=46514 RepID=A0A914A0X5_PATMI|nr:E3 ubiquitin-protein ligase rnf146-like [Patiria miniata]
MAERSPKRSSSAPSLKKENTVTDSADAVNKGDISPGEIPECPVCLQTCIHPVKLPCSHIFCFLCVKGAANQSSRCALCRQGIPVEFFTNPTLVSKKDVCGKGLDLDAETEHYSWFYEGRNGWWQYDERTNVELEENYNAKKRTFELLVAGYMYVIDLDNMVQMRRNDPSRRRRIKRDLVSAPKKGIAGLKIAARPEGAAATVEDQQASDPGKDETAAADGAPPKESGTGLKSVPAGGPGRTKSRSAGVGRDHAHEDPSREPLDQYDADDDYEGTDDEDENDAQWRGSRLRSRPQRQVSRNGRNTHADLDIAQNPLPGARRLGATSTRAHPQGLPIRHHRVSSAPETRPGRYAQPRQPPTTNRVDPPQEQADSTNLDSAMHSLHLPTPDDSVYEPTQAPDQSTRGEVRQRRRRQRQNNDDIWF